MTASPGVGFSGYPILAKRVNPELPLFFELIGFLNS
jgi:hypothetical protein